MERIANASVAALMARLVTQMTEDGYSPSATESVISLAAQLSDFMEILAVMTYDERTGEAFLQDRSRHVAKTALKSMEIFIARLNAAFRGEGFLFCIKRAENGRRTDASHADGNPGGSAGLHPKRQRGFRQSLRFFENAASPHPPVHSYHWKAGS